MTRLNLVVEGQTEEAFVRDLLGPHLAEHKVFCSFRCIRTSRKHGAKFRGGLSTYGKLKYDLGAWMGKDQNPDAYFTTMIDLYGLPKDFPGVGETTYCQSPFDLANTLEEAFREDMNHPKNRFIPYIQVHEFEALLFADVNMFKASFPRAEDAIDTLKEICKHFSSPEDINRDNPPSKRIRACLNDYQKTVDGIAIARRIGLPTMREYCPHFDRWVSLLEQLPAA